jgi:thymidine phosphorylase
MEDKIDPSVGFAITAKPGDRVRKGEALATVYARSKADLDVGRAVVAQAITISESAPASLPLVSHRINAGGVETLS